jgi:hypothetical protein
MTESIDPRCSQDKHRIAALRQCIADTFVRLAEERAQIRTWQQELNRLQARKNGA